MTSRTGRERYKPITKDDVERAMKNTLSNRQASLWLGVSLGYYKKYASQYFNSEGVSLYDAHKAENGKGIPKFGRRKSFRPSVLDLIEGRQMIIPFSVKQIKEKLLQENLLDNCCSRCKFSEKRALDEKVPLILSFKDGNKRNFKLDNLEFLCYNCYFIVIGDLFDKSQMKVLEDYTKVRCEDIDFDLPEDKEKHIVESINLYNRDLFPRPDDFGDDLLKIFNKK